MKIGVDGGGTKTELILITNEGDVLNRRLAPGCNPSVVGPEQAQAVLVEALRELVATVDGESAPVVTQSLMCMAGSTDFWKNATSSLSGYGKIETLTDAEPPLELATGGHPGLVLHAGTGSFVAVRGTDMAFHFIGGFGWRIGDPGSSQDIGRRALRQAVAELQGWAAPSAVGALAREVFGTERAGTVTATLHSDTEPNRILGVFAERVSALASAGDATARGLVLAATEDLLRCAEKAAGAFLGHQRLDTLTAGLSGTILNQDFLVAALSQRTPLRLRQLSDPPIEGVRRLLMRMP